MTDWLLHRLGLCCFRCCPYRHGYGPRPPAVRRLALKLFRRGSRMQASVTAKWTPSVSTDVVKQVVTITVSGVAQPPVELPPAAAEYTFVIAATPALVHADLYAEDADGFRSPVVGADLSIPDLEPPVAPTGLAMTFLPIQS